MSAAKLLLKVRCHVQNPYNSAILIILISFGLISYVTCDIAPKLDDDPTAGDLKALESNLENFSIDKSKHGLDSTQETLQPTTKTGFFHALLAAISFILVSELGDKTFFIAAIMAMRHPRVVVFTGALTALALMTSLSVAFGMAATIIPRVYTYYISTALFAFFGLKMLRDGYYMSATEGQEELEAVQSNLRKREDELMKSLRKDRRKDDDDDESNSDAKECLNSTSSDSHHNTNRRMSGWRNDIHNEYTNDDDDDAISRLMVSKSMTSSNIVTNSSGKLQSLDSARRIQSASNLKSMVTSCNDVNANSIHSLNEINDGNQNAVTTTATVVGNGDINANGIELRRLERDSATAIIQDPESGVIRKVAKRGAYYLTTRVFIQAFTMTFVAEWGDRSQLATIILGARENVYGVIFGGILGHMICTGIAVIGGRMIAQRISVRTVTIVGGIVFLLFALSALFIDYDEE